MVVRCAGLICLGDLGLLNVWLFGYPLGFMVIVAILGLVGVAINSAIVILSVLRRTTLSRHLEADICNRVVGECSRHIFSTALTTLAGFVPLVLTSTKLWPPFAVAIGGGVAFSTILAFYFVPAAFLLVARREKRQLRVVDGQPAGACQTKRLEGHWQGAVTLAK